MKISALLSALACFGAGVYLLQTQPADANSLFGPLLHGMGIYFIGKGIYVGASLNAQARLVRATEWMASQQGFVEEQPAEPEPFLEKK